MGMLRIQPGAFSVEPHPGQLAQPELLAILKDKTALLQIGLGYRQRNPRENNARRLRQEIEHALPTRSGNFKQSLQKAISTDFECGKTLQINGWILSVTEARQCALYSLLNA